MKSVLLNFLLRCFNRNIKLPNRQRSNYDVKNERFAFTWDHSSMRSLQRASHDFLIVLIQVILDKLTPLVKGQRQLRASTREIVYCMKNSKVWRHTSEAGEGEDQKVTRLIDDLCCLFRCSRLSMGITSQEQGYYIGNILVVRQNTTGSSLSPIGEEFEEDGSHLIQSFAINFDTVKNIKFNPNKPRPKCVLVLEKLCAFRELISLELHDFPCVIVTGLGQASQECRMFVKQISTSLELPVLALVDFNPHGYDIFKSYKYGSDQLAFQTKNLTIPTMTIIGLFKSDFEPLDLEVVKAYMQPLKTRDRTLLSNQKDHPWVGKEPDIGASLAYMLKRGRKLIWSSFLAFENMTIG